MPKKAISYFHLILVSSFFSFDQIVEAMQPDDKVVVDTNFNQYLTDYIFQKMTNPIYLDPISVNKASYYNADAKITAAGNSVEVKSTGANFAEATDEAAAKTAEEIGSQAFANELNANIGKITFFTN